MTNKIEEVIRRAVAAALADMATEQLRNLVIGPYLDIREEPAVNPGEFGAGFGADYGRDVQLAKRHVRDLLQNMIDDVVSNEEVDSYGTSVFEDIVYRLMDQV